MIQCFGDFPATLPKSQEYLLLTFSPSSLPLKRRWRNNGLSADFLADYLTAFFPSDEESMTAVSRQAEIQDAVSYIANELLENAMKFSDYHAGYPTTITLQVYPDNLIFLATNSIESTAMQNYQLFIKELLEADPHEMLLQQLQQNATLDYPKKSGLGLLSMISNYAAKLGWKFETHLESQTNTVTIMVQLAI